MSEKKTKLRFRHVFMGIGSFMVLLLLSLTDPDINLLGKLPFGAPAVATLVVLVRSILFVAFLHLSRKGLLDYLDLEVPINKALQTSEGSGKVVIGVGLMMIAIAIVIHAAVSR